MAGFEIPGAKPFHNETINGVGDDTGNGLEDIDNSRGTRTGIGIIINALRKKTAETGFVLPRFLAK
jgi:hypothetical protein